MKIQLYVPPGGYFAERWQENMMPALGHLYIAGVLEEAGYDVEVVPTHVLGLEWGQIADKIRADRPDVIGITTTTENRFLSFRLAEVAKQAHPSAFTIMGGPHFNGTGIDTLEHIRAVDAVCEGEGEETMLETVQAIEASGSLESVAGLTWRNGKITRNPKRALMRDLSTMPMPARHLEPMERYPFLMDVPGVGKVPGGNIMTSRGCPFTCKFCATPTNWGRKMRAITPLQVVDEMQLLKEKYGAQAIWFYDDTFNYSPKRVYEICDEMERRKLHMHWWCEVRVDVMDRALLARMHECGLFGVGFGIESANERVSRDIITKRATLDQAYDVIDWCNELGMVPSAFFVFSHPTETWAEAQETISVIEKVRNRADASMSILHVYPGTPIEERAREEGQLPKDFSWSVEHDSRVVLLPAVQGHAPLYLDKLTWQQICELMVRFSIAHKKVRVGRKLPAVLKSLYSWRDFYRYAVLTLTLLKFRVVARLRGESPQRGPVGFTVH